MTLLLVIIEAVAAVLRHKLELTVVSSFSPKKYESGPPFLTATVTTLAFVLYVLCAIREGEPVLFISMSVLILASDGVYLGTCRP
jgi:hypothetical protein